MVKTTKINRGLYTFTHKGRTFQVENIGVASDGEVAPAWMVYEMVDDEREFWKDYTTKRDAIQCTIEELDGE